MGFESDKLVYDYLSQVGDLAQATPLTAAERARLVAALRKDIDAGRAASGGRGDGAKDVRRLLDRLGKPDEVVRRAVRSGVPGPEREVPPGAPRPSVPRPGDAGPPPDPPEPPRSRSGRGPGIPAQGPAAGREAVGEWWRVPPTGAPRAAYPAAGPAGPPGLSGSRLDFGGWDSVEFDFGAEDGPADPPVEAVEAAEAESVVSAGESAIPAPGGLLRRILPGDRAGGRRPPAAEAAEGTAPDPAAAPPARQGLLRRRAARQVSGPLLLMEALASLVLLAAAVLGLWYLAVLGWFAAYFSPRLGPGARKFAGVGIPLLTLAGGVVWLWLRATGRWGGPPLTGQAYHRALLGLGPVLLRTASALSSAFLAWVVYRRRAS